MRGPGRQEARPWSLPAVGDRARATPASGLHLASVIETGRRRRGRKRAPGSPAGNAPLVRGSVTADLSTGHSFTPWDTSSASAPSRQEATTANRAFCHWGRDRSVALHWSQMHMSSRDPSWSSREVKTCQFSPTQKKPSRSPVTAPCPKVSFRTQGAFL